MLKSEKGVFDIINIGRREIKMDKIHVTIPSGIRVNDEGATEIDVTQVKSTTKIPEVVVTVTLPKDSSDIYRDIEVVLATLKAVGNY